MATLTGLLEEQLRLSFEGGAWHGPSVEETLHDVTAHLAASRPLPGAHTIWELVLHLAGAYSLVLRRVGGDSRPLSPEEDWPPTENDATEAAWAEACEHLRALNRRARQAVLEFPEERLTKPLVDEPAYSAFTQFIGLTQHDLYHAGQIVLLKRAAARERLV